MIDNTVIDISNMSIEQLISYYRSKRQELKSLTDDFSKKERELESEMEEVQNLLLAQSNKMGVDSFKTKSGTAYKVVKTFVSIEDWDKFIDYVRRNDAFHLLQRRVTKSAAIEEMNESVLPDGLVYSEMLEMNIRK